MALLAEAVHSAADVLTSSGVLLGLTIARKPPDGDHPYGHGKVESLVALALAGVLIYVGYSLGRSSLDIFREPREVPGVMALWMAALAIPAKEAMYRYTMRASRILGSVALEADAWHHRCDAIISMVVLAGIAGARMGLSQADPWASLVICLLIARVGARLGWGALNQLLDAQPCPERVRLAEELVGSVPRVREVHCVKARSYGSSLHLDVKIGVDQDLNVKEGHSIAARVKECLRSSLPEVSEVLIHVNPCRAVAPCQGAVNAGGRQDSPVQVPPQG
jgi:cation diffusion facilitator family transporter